ncbi:hypothetical protein [Tunturibacter empetritectus]|uniref:Lipoprotein n=1 Tax=Tunturiibacter empetritectus TaxID=3069691 RepID=A0A7W8IFK2_9BACT|nr:hypothetical protein [Edaphobacter lichenicola]MBB5316087.1 hypothetical protein [Edaphobacter lichenicola]
MIKIVKLLKRYVVFGVVLTLLSFSIIGCEYFPESTFELANESRLPKWVNLPPELTRANASLTMNYYSVPWRKAQFILRDKNGHTLKKENGEMRCRAPFELKNPPQGFPSGYPAYEAISVNGITEIIEHKKMEPIFYVTDDSAVWKQYESLGC